jgi:exopolysaccharide biosynthesis polyprenyl glycosylphosphotransferase
VHMPVNAPPMLTRPVLYPVAPVVSLDAQRHALKVWLIATDAIALAAAFTLAFWVRFNLQVTTAPEVVPAPFFYPFLGALLIPLSVLLLALFRLYDHESLLGGVTEYSKIFNACSTGALIVVIATFLMPDLPISRTWVVSGWVFSFLLVSVNRFACRRLVYPLRGRGYFLTPAVIVGGNEEAVTLAADLSDWRASGLRIVGFVVNGPTRAATTGLPVLGSIADVPRIIRKHHIEELIVAITAIQREELLELCEEVNSIPGVHLRLSSGLYELLTTGITVQTKGNVPLVSVNKVRLAPCEAMAKAALEYSVAIGSLVVLAPVLFLLAVLIKLDSRGPVLHRRRVLGVSGQAFDAFKFRTMQVNGHDVLRGKPELVEELKANHKLKDDPRVTRVGRWLRRYSLDELPQLFNVLLGQMGMVGPRMITAEEGEKYGRHRLNLLTVKPGITGLWQVSGRSDLSYDERVRLDMYYIRNYSVWVDLQILFVQTLPAVLRGRGAY